MRATRGNAARVLEDYGTGVELHEPDMLESCCPCAFRGIGDELLKDADLRPWYADAKLLLIPGPPGASEGVAEVQGALRSAAEANPGKYASLLKHVGNAIETPFTCIPEVRPARQRNARALLALPSPQAARGRIACEVAAGWGCGARPAGSRNARAAHATTPAP